VTLHRAKAFRSTDRCPTINRLENSDVRADRRSVSGYHELMTSLTAQRSPATVRRTGSRAVFLYIADRVENSLFCRMACVLHRRRGHCR
jgi:hypothetical protein